MTQQPAPDAASTEALESTIDPASQQRMKRVASASAVGTMIEFYDFAIYGTAAALVFPQTFFPALGQAAGTVASFAALGVAFVVRPLGSILFGHFGDRLGRKNTLVATLLLMGAATILVGLMPTAAQIGVAAPILIVLLRVMQGLAAGGEWAGAVLFSSEHAPTSRRGFWSMMASFGGGVALFLAPLTFLLVELLMSDDTFVNWGWRIPFLLSFVLVVVGLWVRLAVEETPVFKNQKPPPGGARPPFIDAFRRQPRQILLAVGVTTMLFSLSYIGATYLISYGTTVLELSRALVLGIATIGGAAFSIGTVVGGAVSDYVGRRAVLVGVSGVAIIWTLVLFPILDLESSTAFAVAVPTTMLVPGIGMGTLGAYLSELFETRYRYTAAGLSYSLGGVVGGAALPTSAAWIISTHGSLAFSMVLPVLCLIGLLCVLALGETTRVDLDDTATV